MSNDLYKEGHVFTTKATNHPSVYVNGRELILN